MSVSVLVGDCREKLRELADGSVHCVVTSPPYYGLRDYGMADQIGLEDTPDAYVAQMVSVFREVRRVLRDDGTLWLNIGDSYSTTSKTQTTPKARGGRFGEAGGRGRQVVETEQITLRRPEGWTTGLKSKDLIGIPWMLAFALRADGWYLRQDIIWHKPNPMPESVRDRCTKAHEYVFLLSKSPRYLYNADAIAEESVYGPGEGGHQAFGTPGGKAEIAYGAMVSGKTWDGDGTRNKRSVWSIPTKPFPEAHFATMAPELARTCILAGCPVGGTVLDPFGGAGTTGLVADQLQRNAVLIELNPTYAAMAERRISSDAGMFAEAS